MKSCFDCCIRIINKKVSSSFISRSNHKEEPNSQYNHSQSHFNWRGNRLSCFGIPKTCKYRSKKNDKQWVHGLKPRGWYFPISYASVNKISCVKIYRCSRLLESCKEKYCKEKEDKNYRYTLFFLSCKGLVSFLCTNRNFSRTCWCKSQIT